MATNFSPCKGSYLLNQFPSNVMFGMNGFHVSASGAIQGHHGPLVSNNCLSGFLWSHTGRWQIVKSCEIFLLLKIRTMATNFSPCKESYVLNQFLSNVMFGMNGFHISASGAIQGHHGPLVYPVLNQSIILTLTGQSYCYSHNPVRQEESHYYQF